jgi:CheY-like chemotaxis protein
MGPNTTSVIFIEPLLGELKRAMFEDAGWNVVLHRFGGNPARAIERLHVDHPGLIVLDYFSNREAMARTLIALLQNDEELRRIPILVCRYSDQDVQLLRKALHGSTFVIVSRPYSVEEFMRHAEHLIHTENLQSIDSGAQTGEPPPP